MNQNEPPKRFTSKVEITPVNPYESSIPNMSSNEQPPTTTNNNNNNNNNIINETAIGGKPTPSSNVRHIPIRTESSSVGPEHRVGSPVRAHSPFSHARPTANHEYQSSPRTTRKPPQVRYIPIFVEGSEEPVVPRHVETTPDESMVFAEPAAAATFASRSSADVASRSNGVASTPPSNQTTTPPPPASHEREIPVVVTSTTSSSCGGGGAAAQPPATPPPPPPKRDPLQRVRDVQQEVDNLTRGVEAFGGASRCDKEYLYLDEMLTRNLIKLDDIDATGNDELRTARKNVIRCIQQSIALLESKVPVKESDVSSSQDCLTAAESGQNAQGQSTASSENAYVTSSQEPTPPSNDVNATPAKEQGFDSSAIGQGGCVGGAATTAMETDEQQCVVERNESAAKTD